ncbi:MAG: hypothetical protein R3183_01025 [Oleiphilaceae bacterium]|nr:hypothetical protein [Oleiphilaceae bacterium]
MAEMEQYYTIKTAHDTVFVRLQGSWSAEHMHNFTQEFKQLVGRYFAREWACVMDISDLELLIGEQEQIAAFRALNTWSFIKGMRAQALVVSERNPSYLLYQFEEVLRTKSSYERQVCENESQAEQWLHDYGFSEKLEVQSQKSA